MHSLTCGDNWTVPADDEVTIIMKYKSEKY